MATTDQLCKENLLVRLGGSLTRNQQSQRRLYALPHVVAWIKSDLRGLKTDGYHDNAATPYEQVGQQVNGFVAGVKVENWMVPNLLRPDEVAFGNFEQPICVSLDGFTGNVISLSRISTRRSDVRNTGFMAVIGMNACAEETR